MDQTTWQDNIDPDAEHAELLGSRLGEPDHPRLARSVVCLDVFLTQISSEESF